MPHNKPRRKTDVFVYTATSLPIGARVQVDLQHDDEDSLRRRVVLEQGNPVGTVVSTDGVFIQIEWPVGCTFGKCFHTHNLVVV